MNEQAIFHDVGHSVVEYVTNCAWQIPLLAAGAWVLVKLARPAVRTEYWLWVAVLTMAVVLPSRGLRERTAIAARHSVDVKPVIALVPLENDLHGSFVRSGGEALDVREQVAVMSQKLRSGLRGFRLQMSVRATRWFVGLYLAAMLFAALRLLGAWLRARRLVRSSVEIELGAAAMRSLADAGQKLGVREVQLRESDEIAGPMVVGAFRPVVLLPEGARDYGEDELMAALCHELAHIRRWDYLVNLLCEAVMIPVSWHPVANAVERRIQQTREMVCDEMAAEAMESGEGYARCLVSVTRRIMQQPVAYGRAKNIGAAVGFFDRSTLEERVMRLTTEGEGDAMTGQAKRMRLAGGVLAMAAVVGVAATFHVRPAFGAEITEQAQATVTAKGSGSAAAVVNAPPTKPSAVVTSDGVKASAKESAKEKADTPVAIARGRHATVTAEPGEYVHRWNSRGGEAFAMVNHDAAEPSEEEQQAVEDKLENTGAVLKLDMPDIRLDMPEIKLDMKQLELDKVQIEKAQRLMNDPEMKRQIADAQRQIAELKLHPPQIDLKGMKLQLDMANDAQIRALADSKVNQAQINAQIANAMKSSEAAMARAQKELESGELKARLDAAQQTINDVRRRLEELQKEKK